MPATKTASKTTPKTRRTYSRKLWSLYGLLCVFHDRSPTFPLLEPAASESHERHVLEAINGYVLEVGKPITLRFGPNTFKNIVGAVKVDGNNPKSDIALVAYSESRNLLWRPYFISHKAGVRAKDFQQYSGISQRADERVFAHPEVKAWYRDILPIVDAVASGEKIRYWRTIHDRNLVKMAVFGPDALSSASGPNCADAIAQGTPSMRQVGMKEHQLTFSTGVHERRDVSWAMRSGDNYQAVFAIRYDGTYGSQIPGLGKRWVRMGIMPFEVVGKKHPEL